MRQAWKADVETDVQSIGPDERAISTIAKKWKFTPGRLNGKPVDTAVEIEVSFRLY